MGGFRTALPAGSGIEEGQRRGHELAVVLEDPAMPGVFVDDQLRASDATRHVVVVLGQAAGRVRGERQADVVPAVDEDVRVVVDPSATSATRLT